MKKWELYLSLGRTFTKLSHTTIHDLIFENIWGHLIPRYLSILIFLTIVQPQTDIQYEPWDWVTYKNVDQVFSISEGPEYIYFATNGGILRYHIFGKYWDVPITGSQGLPEDDVRALYYDFNTHMLWAATKNELSYSLNGGGTWETIDPNSIGLRPGETIVRIGSTPGNIWCVTQNQVLQLNSMSGFLLSPYANLPEANVSWGSTLITYMNPSLEILHDFTATGGWMNSVDVFLGPHSEEALVSTIYLDRFNDIWVGTWGGPIFYGDYQMRLLEPLPFGLAQTNVEVLLPEEGGLWIGGIEENIKYSGITWMDKKRGYWDRYRLGHEIFNGDIQLLSGVKVGREIWFGTTEGIQIYDRQRDSWYLLYENKGFPDERVTSIVYDGNYVYAGTPRGIIRFSPREKSRQEWDFSNHLLGQLIYDLYWDGKELWISSELGLWRLELHSQSFRYYSWLKQKGATSFLTKDSISIEIVSPIKAIVSSDSLVYFGDEYGILILNKKEDTWRRLTGESRLIGYQIMDLFISNNGKGKDLWIGTERGAFKMDLNSGFIRRFTKKDGLPTNFITTIFVDSLNAWFGTPEGLVWFNWVRYDQ